MKTTSPHRGTLDQRESYVAARRDSARERDAERIRIAVGLRDTARFAIPEDDGYLVLPPGSIAEAPEVTADANALIDSIGHDKLVTKYNPKHDTMARGFLPKSAEELDSPYMRLALDRDVLESVSAYLGIVPVLHGLDVWYSPPATAEDSIRNAQLWHMDGDDVMQVKLWLHVDDIALESGPLTALGAAQSRAFAEEIGYDTSVEYRITDEKMHGFVDEGELVRFDGPRETVDFVDTSRCFHFGSRVDEGMPSLARRIVTIQYLTPYSFHFKVDHRDEATYRHLASGATSDLEALVLGAR
jgi:hypothetical protein